MRALIRPVRGLVQRLDSTLWFRFHLGYPWGEAWLKAGEWAR